jgi:hypothetical protein
MEATEEQLADVKALAREKGGKVVAFDDGSIEVRGLMWDDAAIEIRTDSRGRWVLASWNERHAQYGSSDIGDEPFQGYVKTAGATVDTLVSLGIRTYPTPRLALEAELAKNEEDDRG